MRITRDLLLSAVGIILFLSAILVALPYFGPIDSKIAAKGTAVESTCRFTGPITESQAPDRANITGFWWVCQAKIRWDDGRAQTREVLAPPLTSGGIQRNTAVVERREDASRTSTRTVVYHAGFEPRPVLGGIAFIVVALVAFVVGAPGAARIVDRLHARYVGPPTGQDR